MTIHATAVAISGQGVLLLGPPGSGKSDLALRLIDRGATLIADDRVVLTSADGILTASSPLAIAGLIEVRGVGIACVDHVTGVAVALVVDLAGLPERLPEPAMRVLLGVTIPVIALDSQPASAALKVERALTLYAGSLETGF